MIDIDELNKRLEQERASWRAGTTSVSGRSISEFRALLRDLAVPRPLPLPPSPKSPPAPAPDGDFDQNVDWRARNGVNYVTSIKDQRNCGCCTSFACIGLVESMALIEQTTQLDLSEADLAFCGSHASNCSGWDCVDALSDMKTRGAVTEARLPYLSVFFPNHTTNGGDVPERQTIPGHDDHSVKVTNLGNIVDVGQRKAYLTKVGPLVCGITAYDELSVYKTGVFSPTSAAVKVGGHDILVIGYSEVGKYWLVKNSWGPNWGENGFGRIAYGACDIDVETASEKTYFTSCDGVIIPNRVRDEVIQSVSSINLMAVPKAAMCDAFFSGDDKMRHVITGATDGQISEIFFSPGAGVGHTVLTTVNGLVDLGAFYTDDDKIRHAVTIDRSGNVKEVFYAPTVKVSVAQLSVIKNATRVAGFYSADDGMRHAVVSTSAGEIFEVYYGKAGVGKSSLGTFGSIVDICAFYSDDDQYRHVIIGAADGKIMEVFYHPTKGRGEAFLGQFPGLKRLGSFYAKGQYFSRRVQILQTDHTVVELRYDSSDSPIVQSLYDGVPVTDIGGCASVDDGLSHCMVLQAGGEVVEIYYNR